MGCGGDKIFALLYFVLKWKNTFPVILDSVRVGDIAFI